MMFLSFSFFQSSRKEAVKSVKRSHIDSDDDTPLSARSAARFSVKSEF